MTPAKRQRRNASGSPPRLPKWVDDPWDKNYDDNLRNSLSIAWAALEHIKNNSHECLISDEAEKAQRAIRRLGR